MWLQKISILPHGGFLCDNFPFSPPQLFSSAPYISIALGKAVDFLKPNERPTTAAIALNVTHTYFPTCIAPLKIYYTLPTTSWEFKRSASALRRLHTYNRATMLQHRFSSLALMHLHYLEEVDLEVVVGLFAQKRPRRSDLEHCSEIH